MKSVNSLKVKSGFEKYKCMDESLLIERIHEKKRSLENEIVILVHHYQKPEIVQFADHIGDSLELARLSSVNKTARFIVFCGVHFMAESASILSDSNQTVILPDLDAGCPLADSARIDQVQEAWATLRKICPGETILPVTYVNSDAELKAFTGRNEGSVCTSTNAAVVFDWAVKNASKVFFFPDEHLGRNTARSRGFQGEDVIVWDPNIENGGNTPESIRRARVVLWNGYCHVHTWFVPEHVRKIRQDDPDAKIIVHPECKEEIVRLADASGSTSFIVNFVQNAPSGSRIVIGTEIHLVKRLAEENPDKTVYELSRSLCPNMYKIGLDDLLYALDFLGKVNVIKVDDDVKRYSKAALERMLRLT